jgi:DNA processing protein
VSDLETAALIALLRAPQRSPAAYADGIEERGSALAVLEDEERGANLARRRLFDDETMQQRLDTAAADLARWRRRGMQALTVLDPDYPENLRGVHDRPPLIFTAGAPQPQDARAVAVIGTRRPSASGEQQAEEIAAHLVQAGYTVVSGLAAGIDTAVHEGALAAGGRTLAVIGTGLAHTYPPQNAALQARIAESCAVISQFWPEAPPSRQTFPMRNATMSGLALASVVVEARETSGARTQTRRALNHGRPVFLMDSLLAQQPWARELVTKPGVHVATSPDQITHTIERLAPEQPLVA